jgi:CRP/FNR family transcriptional regulator, cyclic AMP receptor protein
VLRRNEKVELIKKVPLFAGCSKRELEEIAHIADEIDLNEGKEMTRQGARGREFFVLLEGEADVTKDGQSINKLGAGDFFGEIALLRDVPRTATVTARTESTVFALERADFLAAVVGNARFGHDTTRLAEDRLEASAHPLVAVSVRPPGTPRPAD